MEIKKSSRAQRSRWILRYFRHYPIMVGLFILLMYTSFVFLAAGLAYKEGFFGRILVPAVEQNINIPLNFLKGITTKVEHIDIDIKNKHFHKIEGIRNRALAEGVLHTSSEDSVPAVIRWAGKTVDVKIRLKGNWPEHWSRDTKWSFLVEARGGDTVRGMKNFSLLHPETRGYLNDWYLLQLAKFYANCIVLRYDFVDVTLNGKHLGILLMEEHFDDILLENNGYIDSVIVKINDRLLRYVEPDIGLTPEHINETYTILPIKAFNKKIVKTNEKYFQYFVQAKNLLESFRRGKLHTHEVFDIDKLAKCFAISDLMGSRESIAYSNLIFYYNPITSLLEPILRDNNDIYEGSSVIGESRQIERIPFPYDRYSYSNENIWTNTFFKDKLFYERYVQCLEEISSNKFLDTFFEKTDKESKQKLNALYKSFPQYKFLYKSVLYGNQKLIKNIINPMEGIQAYLKKYDEKKGRIILEVGNTCSLPVEVLDTSLNEYGYVLKPASEKVILQAKKPSEFIRFQEIEFGTDNYFHKNGDIKDGLKLTYRILGTSSTRKVQVNEWSYLDEDSIHQGFMQEKPNHKQFKFTTVDSQKKAMFIKKGVWNIDKNMIIPEGFTVTCSKGTKINLTNSAKILSYSPLNFVGSSEEPIIITSDDSTGHGIIVVNSKKVSFLENVIFKNLTSPSKGNWGLQGSITFYQSPVHILSCGFIGDRSRSGVNMVRSEFNIEKSYFTNSHYNAFSVSFGKGKISETSIDNSGGDGVNLSGCVVEIGTLFCRNIHGAALSANEKSQLSVKDLKVDKTQFGITSSDLSSVIVENIDIDQALIGFVVYQKRKEFGPALLNVRTIKRSSNLENDHALEEGSILRIGGKDVKPNKVNVREILIKGIN